MRALEHSSAEILIWLTSIPSILHLLQSVPKIFSFLLLANSFPDLASDYLHNLDILVGVAYFSGDGSVVLLNYIEEFLEHIVSQPLGIASAIYICI